MKKLIVIIIFIIILFSCKKKEVEEYRNVFGDIVYTDSFSPPEWENPTMRKRYQFGDKDIGPIISPDILEPNKRKIYLLIKRFIDDVKKNDLKKIKGLLTASAYNSFVIRYSDFSLEEEFESIRVGLPPLNVDKEFEIKVKVLFLNKSVVGKFGIIKKADSFLINDFDDSFFNKIRDLFEHKKKTKDASSDLSKE